MGIVFSLSTSHLKIGDLECEGEVGGDDEGFLLFKWPMNLDLISIHNSSPPSSTKNVGSRILEALIDTTILTPL